MITIWTVIGILLLHLIADFFLQTDWMAINKSKQWDALLVHTSTYSVCFAMLGVPFVCITFLMHTATDYITSRITSYLWQREERHWFFVVIGIDQFIHYVTLLLTYWLLFNVH